MIKLGDIEKLEHIVLEGQGKKLAGEYSSDYKIRTYLKNVPFLMVRLIPLHIILVKNVDCFFLQSKMSLLHDAVNSGKLEELKALLDEDPDKRKKFVMCKDEAGVGLLHKAVYYDLKDIYKHLLDNFPQMVAQKDSVKVTNNSRFFVLYLSNFNIDKGRTNALSLYSDVS